ncbi:hypothetical protein ACI3E1_07020 [Ligilactobacillus sp. LYQ139]|uniref:hypothetical protein n=1 Tax=Ligilactobacillus sp. LYQ139 TaxID=3378800 RepID=UPI003854408E
MMEIIDRNGEKVADSVMELIEQLQRTESAANQVLAANLMDWQMMDQSEDSLSELLAEAELYPATEAGFASLSAVTTKPTWATADEQVMAY